MKNAGKIDKSRDHAILSYSMVSVFTVIACILTVYHSLLRPNPLHIYYVIIASLLITIGVVSVVFITSNNVRTVKSLSKTSIFLSIYILLMIWLAINITIPEYDEIMKFQKKRIELIYWDAKKELGGHRKLALLYMRAKPEISRIEPNANNWGTKLMRVYMLDQMENGPTEHYKKKGYSMGDDMYELAEAAFIYSSREIAHTWYKKAFEYGREDALTRYNERIKHYR